MIEAIKAIGEYAIRKEGKNINDPLGILIEDPESNPKNPAYKHILSIILDANDGKYEYKGIDHEQYSKDRINLYLYKQGSSKGRDLTPTSRITTIKSTFSNTKILPWFKEYKGMGLDHNTDFLVKIGDCLRENSEKIQEDLEVKHDGINKKEKAVLTLKIDGRYIGEYEIFKTILLEESKKGFYSKYGIISKAEDKICYVCNERRAEVYGFVSTYHFYTVDKPGFVSGGFHQKNAWKNYPVCLNCALTLEAGKDYLKHKLNFNLYGFNYHLIPKLINEGDYEVKKELFDLIEDWNDPKIRKKEINRLTRDENEILGFMSEQQNYLNMNFMFYDAPKGYDGAVFNILSYIEDVLPSRLRELFDVKNRIDKINVFKECMVPVFENKKITGVRPLKFNFGVVRTFFPKISNNRTYDRYFLDIVNKIFTDKPIDHDFLLRFIMQKIREEFIKDYPTKISTLKGFMMLKYLNMLGILRHRGEFYMESVDNLELEETKDRNHEIKSFFSMFSDFFDSDAKRAIFLEGVLTQFLLNIQYQERKATPFRAKLKGLKLDEKEIKKLLPEIQNKLEEYGKNYYKALESIIASYFVSAGNGWKLTNDEISFYFVLGMNLSDKFKSKKGEENGGNVNE
ncbi:MAG: hypothetical protein BA871_00440 [Desulfuromonadales bacterium C00003096]|nr:MAG: hypothetical protein BA871_00440 [Desulfuromonadales bacterium C00003096]